MARHHVSRPRGRTPRPADRVSRWRLNGSLLMFPLAGEGADLSWPRHRRYVNPLGVACKGVTRCRDAEGMCSQHRMLAVFRAIMDMAGGDATPVSAGRLPGR